MTAVKHMPRRKPGTAGTTVPVQQRNSQLREQFPPRPSQPWWPETAQGQEWSVPAFMDTKLGCQLTELPIP